MGVAEHAEHEGREEDDDVVGAEAAEDEAPAQRQGFRQETADRILVGAERALSRAGARGTSMEDVAREAGVTRMTVYRYYASRDDLMRALLEREMGRYYAEVDARGGAMEAAAQSGQNPAKAVLVELIGFSIEYFAEHPILNALLENDPDMVLPIWTTRAEEMLRIAVGALAPSHAQWMEKRWIKPLRPDWVAEWLSRLVMSWFIQRSPIFDTHDPDTIRELVETFVWPVLDPGPQGPTER